MRELLKNPCAMATAQQEIESVVGLGRNGLLKESDVKDCVYLRCLVKETLRLHPPGPLLIPHQSTEGRTVGRYHIPERTRLFVNVWAMGRDESIWEDPYLFKPDRFMGKSIDLRGQHYELLPFGTRRRGCPGISMGLCVVELALAQLLHCFDWSVEGEATGGGRLTNHGTLWLLTPVPLLIVVLGTVIRRLKAINQNPRAVKFNPRVWGRCNICPTMGDTQPNAYLEIPSPVAQLRPTRYEVFINHRGIDVKETVASLIYHNLSNKGCNVFLDKKSIQIGHRIPKCIVQAIRTASVH
ncbi:hypothetical protein KI387_036036, partial [Taxus chinensis]